VTTYNHAFSISFAVPNCTNADPHEAREQEKDRIMFALRKRLHELTDNEGEYLASADPYDTYEE